MHEMCYHFALYGQTLEDKSTVWIIKIFEDLKISENMVT